MSALYVLVLAVLARHHYPTGDPFPGIRLAALESEDTRGTVAATERMVPMVENAADVQPGMQVYAADGQEIGKVAHVWRDIPMTDTSAAPAPSTTTTPLSASETSTSTTEALSGAAILATGYFQVEHGGILGIGGTSLYVPFSTVEDLVRGDCLTLSCRKEECDQLYAHKPDSLDGETAASDEDDMPPLV